MSHANRAAGLRPDGIASAAGLAAAAAIHAVWASGSSWPASDRDELADLVVGTRPMPGQSLIWAVTGLIAGAAAVVAADAGLIPPLARRFPRQVRRGARTVAVVLTARGAGGLVMSGLAVGNTTELFRRSDVRLYSPLCIALAAGIVTGRRRYLTPER
ncbi:DUF3995 domain-containing protein [Aeromicrobium sp.]|uniref:DUF3995 domain-containing protein n=1 Tax=Aeromicrobium sp. TaxID=1871063 RepID=UPI0030C285ED